MYAYKLLYDWNHVDTTEYGSIIQSVDSKFVMRKQPNRCTCYLLVIKNSLKLFQSAHTESVSNFLSYIEVRYIWCDIPLFFIPQKIKMALYFWPPSSAPDMVTSIACRGARERFGVINPGGTTSSCFLEASFSYFSIPKRLKIAMTGMNKIEDRIRKAMTTYPHAGYSSVSTWAWKLDDLTQKGKCLNYHTVHWGAFLVSIKHHC